MTHPASSIAAEPTGDELTIDDLMDDVSAGSESAGSLPWGGSPATPPSDVAYPASPARCPGCDLELRGRAVAARFCPRCGAALAVGLPRRQAADLAQQAGVAGPPVFGVPAAALPAGEDACRRAAEWARLRDAAAAAVAAGHRGPAAGDGGRYAAGGRTAILRGYANAMCRLGLRYESGHGVARNADEAVRCYLKAARLGDPVALDRLAPQCAGAAGTGAGGFGREAHAVVGGAPLPVLPL